MVKERITVSIDKQVLKELDDFCEKNYSVARSLIIVKAVRQFLKKQSQKDTGE